MTHAGLRVLQRRNRRLDAASDADPLAPAARAALHGDGPESLLRQVLKSAPRRGARENAGQHGLADGLLLAPAQRKFQYVMLGSVLDRFVCCAVAGAFLFPAAGASAQEPPAPFAPSATPMPTVETPPAADAPAAASPPDGQTATPALGPLSLTWVSADPSCAGNAVGPRALELVSRGITPRPTEARARVERDGVRWSVQLETRSQSRMGQRTLRGESCKEIQQAIALLLAMIMEAEAKGESTPPTAPPEVLSMLNPDEDPVVDVAPLPVAVPRGLELLVRTEGSAAVGLQPSLGLGVGGSVGAALSSFELRVNGAYWPRSRAAIFNRDGTIEMTRQAAGAALCYRWLSSGRIELLSCLGPEWLWVQWRSSGLQQNREGRIRHLATLNGSLDLRLAAIGPLFVSFSPGFTWEQRRPFRAQRCDNCTPTDVFHTWDIGLRFGAGIGARF